MEALFAGEFNPIYGTDKPTVPDITKDYFWYVTDSCTVDGKKCPSGSLLAWDSASRSFNVFLPPTFQQIQGKSEEATRWPRWDEVDNKPSNIVLKDENGDISVRMVRSNHHTQSVIPDGSAMAFRINSTDKDFIRFATKDAIKDYLGTVHDSYSLQGYSLEGIKVEVRNGLVPSYMTVNGYRLDKPINITPSDLGLNNVANYGNTSSPLGTSTTLYATQRAAYEASAAPRLEDDRKRLISIDKTDPIPNAPDGIYIKLDEASRTFTMQVKSEGVLYTKA